MLVFNLKQIGIDLEVKYFDINALAEKAATPGEPFDLVHRGLGSRLRRPGRLLRPAARTSAALADGVNLDDPRVNARIEAANRLTGEARRKAWADLDVDLMRDNPPWAPLLHNQARTFVSQELGCFLDHPVCGVDLAAVCKK